MDPFKTFLCLAWLRGTPTRELFTLLSHFRPNKSDSALVHGDFIQTSRRQDSKILALASYLSISMNLHHNFLKK